MKKSKIRKNLNLSTIEGMFWAIMYGSGDSYISALGVFLGFTAFQISLLNSIPQFIGSCFQLLSATIKNKFQSIRKFVSIISLIQALMWIILIYLIKNYDSYLIILIWTCLYFSLASVIAPAWTAWMGYFVPNRLRARYFGRRNRIIGFTTFIATFIAGYILEIFDKNMISGFTIIFTIAFFGRLLSAFYLNKKYDFKQKETHNLYEYIKNFKNKANSNHSFYYIIFISYISFSMMFFGPLFSIYMLRTMGFSIFIYTIVITLFEIFNFSSSAFFGKIAEKIGDYNLLRISVYIIILLPIFWILIYYIENKNYQILVTFIVSALAGTTFSAFNLSSFNLIYKISNKEDIIYFSSVINFSRGTAILIGGISAGFLVESNIAQDISILFNTIPIHVSMVLSIILRLFCLPLILKLK